jgi:hypothetical protein
MNRRYVTQKKEPDKSKVSRKIAKSNMDSLTELYLNKSMDEDVLKGNSITFKHKKCNYGSDMTVLKLFHYSDISSRIHRTRTKSNLDHMPELEQLKNFAEPIPFNKV